MPVTSETRSRDLYVRHIPVSDDEYDREHETAADDTQYNADSHDEEHSACNCIDSVTIANDRDRKTIAKPV